MSDAATAARECARRIDALVLWLGLAPARKEQGCFKPLNPTRADRRPGSFVIYGAGHAKAGGWVDFATGDKGDAFDLLSYCQIGRIDRRESLAIARRFLGWDGAKALPPTPARQALEADLKAAEERAAAERADHRRSAQAQWLKARPLAPGGAVWRYLTLARGVDLMALSAPPRALREIPDAKHKESNSWFPVMCALISGPDGVPWATHRTWLVKDGSGKAPVDPPRKIWPAGFWGGAIRISRGASGLTPADAPANSDVLAITEGVEDALTVAAAAPEWRVWAAGVLGNMGQVIVPACCRAVVLIRDADEEAKRRAGDEAAAAKAAGVWRKVLRDMAGQCAPRGLALYDVAPRQTKDFNDALRSHLAALAKAEGL
jgi:hypothetical protein